MLKLFRERGTDCWPKHLKLLRTNISCFAVASKTECLHLQGDGMNYVHTRRLGGRTSKDAKWRVFV
jgi:hypothetical protein